MSRTHEDFVKLTRSTFLNKLAESETYKVGSWFKGPTRPDVFIIQHPSLGSDDTNDSRLHLRDWKDNAFVIECKVEVDDIRRGLFQLLLAEAAILRHADLDFAHGGLRFLLVIPEALREELKEIGLFEELKELYKSIHFGLAVIDDGSEQIDWILWPASFM